jgi:hypothetical protein
MTRRLSRSACDSVGSIDAVAVLTPASTAHDLAQSHSDTNTSLGQPRALGDALDRYRLTLGAKLVGCFDDTSQVLSRLAADDADHTPAGFFEACHDRLDLVERDEARAESIADLVDGHVGSGLARCEQVVEHGLDLVAQLHGVAEG